MVEIKLLEAAEIMELCARIGLPKQENLFVYSAKERGQILGSCGFTIDGENGTLVFTHMEEDGLAPIEDGLLRSALSMMYEHGVHTTECSDRIPEKMLRPLGFNEQDGVYTLYLPKSFLTQGCAAK